jgi:peptidoglycan/xylan/chitin deacetylase (PgdA/CDA1 family)
MFDLTLTFDNGPEPEATPAVLDILKRRMVRASFFVIGEKLVKAGARALCERAHAEGHWIGNHSWTHSVPFGERSEGDLAENEIGRTQGEIGDLAHPQRFFRPSGGGGHLDKRLLNAQVVEYLKREKFTCVLWNSIPRDWNDPDGWVERALDQCRAQSWTLMVLHDLPTGAMRHLDRFLDKVAEAGGRLRQDFPPDCMPIVEGIVTRPLGAYVADGGR